MGGEIVRRPRSGTITNTKYARDRSDSTPLNCPAFMDRRQTQSPGPRRPSLCRLRCITAGVFVGAAISIVLALSCAIATHGSPAGRVSYATSRRMPNGFVMDYEVRFERCRIVEGMTWGPAPLGFPANGERVPSTGAEPSWGAIKRAWDSHSIDRSIMYILQYQYGWPWPALGYCKTTHSNGTIVVAGAWYPKTIWQSTGQGSPVPALPLKPRITGLIWDSLFWGVLFVCAQSCMNAKRRNRRRRRRRCINCAYDLTGMNGKVCPECGCLQ